MIQALRFATLLLAALGLAPGAAHLLELLPKLHYPAATYMAVTGTLYRYFGVVGGAVQVGALLTASWLAFLLRRRRSFGPVLAGALGLLLSLALWAMLVAPVNAEWAEALQSAPRSSAIEAYLRLRPRWEYGHVAAFVAWLAGYSLLLLGVLTTDRDRRGD